jgi:hypothetical protein|tara:strand:- start:4358 stop:4657 length:300 start_codon:yes stop_codon:yes gene_type:complete
VLSELPVGAVVVVVFVAQFTFIALKGLQQINVVAGRFWRAGMVSFWLGVSGLVTLDILANSLVNGAHWTVYISYLASGVFGIWLAMWIEERRKAREEKR